MNKQIGATTLLLTALAGQLMLSSVASAEEMRVRQLNRAPTGVRSDFHNTLRQQDLQRPDRQRPLGSGGGEAVSNIRTRGVYRSIDGIRNRSIDRIAPYGVNQPVHRQMLPGLSESRAAGIEMQRRLPPERIGGDVGNRPANTITADEWATNLKNTIEHSNTGIVRQMFQKPSFENRVAGREIRRRTDQSFR